MEKSPDERTRVSAAGLRSFLNIADRWELSSSERLELLQCDARQYGEWSTVARSNGPLVLEMPVLLRISALLGVFKDAQQLYGSPEKERDWLHSTNMAAPYQGRAPIDLLRGTLDDQLAVRGEVAAIRWGGGFLSHLTSTFSLVCARCGASFFAGFLLGEVFSGMGRIRIGCATVHAFIPAYAAQPPLLDECTAAGECRGAVVASLIG